MEEVKIYVFKYLDFCLAASFFYFFKRRQRPKEITLIPVSRKSKRHVAPFFVVVARSNRRLSY